MRWFGVLACCLLGGCFLKFEDPQPGDDITCSTDAPACPEGWQCDTEVQRCFPGGVSTLPGVRTSPTALTTAEDGPTSTDTLSISLLTAPTAPVSVQLSSSDPSEGIPSLDVLDFTPTNWDQPQLVRILGVDDDTLDGDRPYRVLVGPTASADARYSGLPAVEVAAVNQDRDVAALVVTSAPSLLTTESGGSAVFSVSLAAAPTQDVTVPVGSSPATEVAVTLSALLFTPANWDRLQDVIVSGVNDPVPQADGDVPFSISLGPSTSSDPAFAGLTAAVPGLNADDDVPGFIVDAAGGVVVSEAGTQDTFTVKLRTRPAAPLTLPITSAPAGVVTVTPASLVLDATNWDTGAVATVTGLNDSPPQDDGDQVVTISLGPATSSDPVYDGGAPADVSATALDDDVPAFVFSPLRTLIVSESGTPTATVQVTLATRPSANVTVPVVAAPASEASVSPTSLTFTSADWDAPHSLSVSGVNDSPPMADGNASFTIDLGAASSTDSSYAGLDPAPLPGINSDDDVPAIVLGSVAPLSALETSGAVTVTTVTLATRPVSTVTVPVTLSSTGRGTVSPTALTFTGSNWNVPATVSFDPADDATRNGDAAIQVRFGPATGDSAYAGRTASDVQVTVRDDERRILLSSFYVQGDLNTGAGAGLLAVDVACSNQGGGNYKALLASSGTRQPRTSSWVIVPGYTYLRGSSVRIGVADSRGQLPDPLDNSTTGSDVRYWTGIGLSGIQGDWEPSANCVEWSSTSSTPIGSTGRGTQVNWAAFASANEYCNVSLPVLCVEQ